MVAGLGLVGEGDGSRNPNGSVKTWASQSQILLIGKDPKSGVVKGSGTVR